MNCFEWLERAKKYASNIWDEYMTLIQLEKLNQKESENYQQVFENLKELIELERMFYNLMSVYELDFIYKRIDKTYDLEDYTIITPLEIAYTPDDFIMIRVGLKAIETKIQKEYSISDCGQKQIGMISLIPVKEDNEFLKLLHITNLIWGCFSSTFCYLLKNNIIYPKSFSIENLYIASYTKTNIENYFLNNRFDIDEESTIRISEKISDIYLVDNEIYKQYCSQVVLNIWKNLLISISSLKESDFPNQESLEIILELASDIFYTILVTVPGISAIYCYQLLKESELVEKIKSNFQSKLEPLLEEKRQKTQTALNKQ